MDRVFSVNHPLLFILSALAVPALMTLPVVFGRKTRKRALELGYSSQRLNKLSEQS